MKNQRFIGEVEIEKATVILQKRILNEYGWYLKTEIQSQIQLIVKSIYKTLSRLKLKSDQISVFTEDFFKIVYPALGKIEIPQLISKQKKDGLSAVPISLIQTATGRESLFKHFSKSEFKTVSEETILTLKNVDLAHNTINRMINLGRKIPLNQRNSFINTKILFKTLYKKNGTQLFDYYIGNIIVDLVNNNLVSPQIYNSNLTARYAVTGKLTKKEHPDTHSINIFTKNTINKLNKKYNGKTTIGPVENFLNSFNVPKRKMKELIKFEKEMGSGSRLGKSKPGRRKKI